MMQSIPATWRMVKLGTCLQRRKDTVLPATLSDTTVGLVGLEDILDGGQDQAASWFHPRFRGGVRDRLGVRFDGTQQDLKARLEANNAYDSSSVRNLDELFDFNKTLKV